MDILALLQAIVQNKLLYAVLVLMALNIVSGVAAGLYTRNLRLAEIGDWLMTRAIPYVLGGGCMQAVMIAMPAEMSGISTVVGNAVWGFVIASLMGKILANLAVMGLPVPVVLTDHPKTNTTATP